MKIHVDYSTQMRAMAQVAKESVEVEDSLCLGEFIKRLAKDKPIAFGHFLFAEEAIKPGVMIFVNDETPASIQQYPLRDGDRVSMMTLVSGG